MRRAGLIAVLTMALSACGGDGAATLPVERLQLGPALLEVQAEGELRATKATPLLVPGAQWAQRELAWMKAEGSTVAAGEVVARFVAPVGKLELAKSQFDLRRNALAHGGKYEEMRAMRERVDVDLAQVGTDLGIAQRYADADLDMFARNQVLDAVQDEAFLGEKQDVLQWRRGQGERRGAAEIAVLDSQRSTYELNARTRREDLAALELVAPHDGVLVLTADWAGEKPKIGGGLWAGMEFGSLPDTAAMEVRLALPQLMAQGLRAGAEVRLHPLGRPDLAFDSSLSWVAGAAQPKSRDNPVKYVQMKAPVPSDIAQRLALVPGQAFAARIVTWRTEQGLTVPNVAVIAEGGRDYVLLRHQGVLQRRAVELGERGLARSEVRGGLKPGDEVVLTPEAGP